MVFIQSAYTLHIKRIRERETVHLRELGNLRSAVVDDVEAHVFHTHARCTASFHYIINMAMHYTQNTRQHHVHITHPGGRTCGGIYATEVIIHAYYKYFIIYYYYYYYILRKRGHAPLGPSSYNNIL